MQPMLAVAVAAAEALPADGTTWSYEVKWDGVRVLAVIGGGRLRLLSRAGNDVTAGYPELAGLAQAVSGDVVLDGEVVVLRGGVPSFAALAERMHVREPRRVAALAAAAPATFLVFDLLRRDGDLTSLPWQQRREVLEQVLPPGPAWQLSPVYDDRDLLVAAARDQGLEGVVAKRRSSRYLPGGRTGDWIKLAFKSTRSVLVGGWRWETGGRDRIGALLVGTPNGAGGVGYRGRVGSGITATAERALRERLEPLRCNDSRFATEVPPIDAAGAQWVTPELVIEVRSLGTSSGGRLRQPVFLAVRDDLRPADLIAEPVAESVAGQGEPGDG